MFKWVQCSRLCDVNSCRQSPVILPFVCSHYLVVVCDQYVCLLIFAGILGVQWWNKCNKHGVIFQNQPSPSSPQILLCAVLQPQGTQNWFYQCAGRFAGKSHDSGCRCGNIKHNPLFTSGHIKNVSTIVAFSTGS